MPSMDFILAQKEAEHKKSIEKALEPGFLKSVEREIEGQVNYAMGQGPASTYNLPSGKATKPAELPLPEWNNDAREALAWQLSDLNVQPKKGFVDALSNASLQVYSSKDAPYGKLGAWYLGDPSRIGARTFDQPIGGPGPDYPEKLPGKIGATLLHESMHQLSLGGFMPKDKTEAFLDLAVQHYRKENPWMAYWLEKTRKGENTKRGEPEAFADAALDFLANYEEWPMEARELFSDVFDFEGY